MKLFLLILLFSQLSFAQHTPRPPVPGEGSSGTSGGGDHIIRLEALLPDSLVVRMTTRLSGFYSYEDLRGLRIGTRAYFGAVAGGVHPYYMVTGIRVRSDRLSLPRFGVESYVRLYDELDAGRSTYLEGRPDFSGSRPAVVWDRRLCEFNGIALTNGLCRTGDDVRPELGRIPLGFPRQLSDEPGYRERRPGPTQDAVVYWNTEGRSEELTYYEAWARIREIQTTLLNQIDFQSLEAVVEVQRLHNLLQTLTLGDINGSAILNPATGEFEVLLMPRIVYSSMVNERIDNEQSRLVDLANSVVEGGTCHVDRMQTYLQTIRLWDQEGICAFATQVRTQLGWDDGVTRACNTVRGDLATRFTIDIMPVCQSFVTVTPGASRAVQIILERR